MKALEFDSLGSAQIFADAVDAVFGYPKCEVEEMIIKGSTKPAKACTCTDVIDIDCPYVTITHNRVREKSDRVHWYYLIDEEIEAIADLLPMDISEAVEIDDTWELRENPHP